MRREENGPVKALKGGSMEEKIQLRARILAVLGYWRGHGGQSLRLTQIAKLTSIDKGNVHRYLVKLIEAGLVKKEKDKFDNKRLLYSPTDDYEALRSRFRKRFPGWFLENFQHFPGWFPGRNMQNEHTTKGTTEMSERTTKHTTNMGEHTTERTTKLGALINELINNKIELKNKRNLKTEKTNFVKEELGALNRDVLERVILVLHPTPSKETVRKDLDKAPREELTEALAKLKELKELTFRFLRFRFPVLKPEREFPPVACEEGSGGPEGKSSCDVSPADRTSAPEREVYVAAPGTRMAKHLEEMEELYGKIREALSREPSKWVEAKEEAAKQGMHPRYWGMSPEKRTWKFIEDREKALSKHHSGYKRFPVKGLIRKMKTARLRDLIKARIEVDIAGRRYDLFFDAVYEQNKTENPTHPIPPDNQLRSDRYFRDPWLKYTEAQKRSVFMIEREDLEHTGDPDLLPENFRPGAELSDAYEKQCDLYFKVVMECKRLASGGGDTLTYWLERAIGAERILSEEYAEGYGVHHNFAELEGYRYIPRKTDRERRREFIGPIPGKARAVRSM
jgi:DNA-binding MarR family transcriptional regulator